MERINTKCIYEVNEICTNVLCPQRNGYCSLVKDCNHKRYEKENRRMSQKECFAMAIMSHIDVWDDLVDILWGNFVDLMHLHGYLEE